MNTNAVQGTLVWSHQMQNLIFSGTFWGALLVVGPSTLIYHRCSPRLLLFAAVVVYITSTAVTPLLAVHAGATTVFMARVFMGFGEVCFSLLQQPLSLRIFAAGFRNSVN